MKPRDLERAQELVKDLAKWKRTLEVLQKGKRLQFSLIMSADGINKVKDGDSGYYNMDQLHDGGCGWASDIFSSIVRKGWIGYVKWNIGYIEQEAKKIELEL